MINFIYTLWIFAAVCIPVSFMFMAFLVEENEALKHGIDIAIDVIGSSIFLAGVLSLLVASALSTIDLFFRLWGIPQLLGYLGFTISVLTYSLIVAIISIKITEF
jgi:hypothetical protein